MYVTSFHPLPALHLLWSSCSQEDQVGSCLGTQRSLKHSFVELQMPAETTSLSANGFIPDVT